MNLEEEMVEISVIYHGTREYVEELERGMADCNKKIEQLEALVKDYDKYIAYTFPRTYEVGETIQELRQRAKGVLGEKAS